MTATFDVASFSSFAGGESRPDYAFARHRCLDADEAAQRLRAWDQMYQQLAPGAFEGETTDIWLGSMQVFRERSNRRVHQAGSAWPGSITFGVPLAMQGAARFCGQAMDLDSVLVLGPESELDFLTSPTLDIVGISMRYEQLASLEQRRSTHEPASAWTSARLIRLDPAAAARLRAPVRALFEVIEADPARLGRRGVREQIGDDLVNGLAEVLLDAAVPPPIADRHVNERTLVRQARDYVLAHADDPITVERLCRVLGLSRRSLQYAFEHVLGTSPVQYLRAARLHGVRRELKRTPRAAASIQDIAARWGFWHLGHFITQYRQLFGCRPSETPRPV